MLSTADDTFALAVAPPYGNDIGVVRKVTGTDKAAVELMRPILD